MRQDNQVIAEVEDASKPYVGQWHRLVSTTNWEKGRIIHEWRSALIAARAPATEYSDEAWARTVGGVSGQHAGRLRRVYDRFGQVHDQFDGLYWSHFQSAVDWDDAEMWLEGAIQNDWSVSLMRQQRWLTLGAIQGQEPCDEDVVTSELDEDVVEDDATRPAHRDMTSLSGGEYSEARSPAGPDFGDDDSVPPAIRSDDTEIDSQEPVTPLVRPFENLPELPDDLAEVYESWKLAILRHKSDEWRQVPREDVIACLDALKILVLA